MINSRKKGNNAELQVCRVLSEWWDKKDYSKTRAEDLPFRRTPLSGGWDKKRAAGDLLKPEDCRLCIEVKKRQEWSWDSLFKNINSDGGNWKVFDYWSQAKLASKKGELPILIFSKNGHPWYVCATRRFVGPVQPFLSLPMWNKNLVFHFYSLNDFIRIKPSCFKTITFNF